MELCSICKTETGKGLLFYRDGEKIARLYFCIPLCQENSAKLGCVECGKIVDILEVINGETPVGRYALLCEECREGRAKFSIFGCHCCGTEKGPLGHCKGCGYARYCSQECRGADWEDHKKHCPRLGKK
jgi:hypothetical protein